MKDNYIKNSANRWMMFIPLLILFFGSLISINIAHANNVFVVDVTPVIENFSPPATAQVGQPYSYQVQVSQVSGGEVMTYTLNNAPDFMSINGTGLISWTPTLAQTGTHNSIEVVAANNDGSDSAQFSVQVNQAPQITSAVPTNFAIVGEEYTHTVTASGAPAPNFSIDAPLPAGMQIGLSSGIITWTPSSLGDPTVTVRAANGISPDATQSFTIPVYEKPVISTTAVTAAVVGVQYQYNVDATGYPAPVFTLLPPKPSNMNINSTTGLITWTPNDTQTGSRNVTVRATNAAGFFDQPFTIQVGELPQISPIPDDTITVGDSFNYTAVGDGIPAPTYSLDDDWGWLSINPTTGEISGTAAQVNSGKNKVTVRVTNTAGSSTTTFIITVQSTAICLMDDIVSYWKFEDAITTDTRASDFVWSNDALCAYGSVCPRSEPNGVIGNMVEFNITQKDRLEVSEPTNIDWAAGDSFSVQLWVKTTQDCSGNKVFIGKSRNGDSSQGDWWLGCDSSGVGRFSLRQGSASRENNPLGLPYSSGLSYTAVDEIMSTDGDLSGTTLINDGQWHQLIAVRSASTNKTSLYVDGTLEASITETFNATLANDQPLTIGHFTDNITNIQYYFSGQLDEITIHDRALSEVYIAQMNRFIANDVPYCTEQNNPVVPTIVSTAKTTATAGFTYTYEVKAVGLPLPTYSFEGAKPANMSVDVNTGVVTWPVDSQEPQGVIPITVKATNSADSDTQSFDLAVDGAFFVYLPTIVKP